MEKLRNQLLVLGISFFIFACNNATTDTSSKDTVDAKSSLFDAETARPSIEAQNAKIGEAIRKGDSTAIAAVYASDAWMLPPNSDPVKGKDVVSAWGGFLRMGIKDLKLSTDEVRGYADLLAETGKYELYGDNKKLMDKGKYIVLWKQENGEWKIFRDIWNTSMPAAPAK